jgi:hypothetical protein
VISISSSFTYIIYFLQNLVDVYMALKFGHYGTQVTNSYELHQHNIYIEFPTHTQTLRFTKIGA